MNLYIKNIIYILLLISILINFIDLSKDTINNSLICNIKKYNCKKYYNYDNKKEEKRIIINKYKNIFLYSIYIILIIILNL